MRNINVLIVEDEMIIAKDIAHQLELLGCEICDILMEGESVIPFLKKTIPDIILMDINLKGEMDGIETVRLIKKKYAIPIIYMTANTDDQSFEMAKATKPFAFIEKPFKVRNLVRTFELLIEQIIHGENDQQKEDISSFMLKNSIFIKDKDKMVKILIKDILYIEAERAYSRIRTNDKEYLISTSLKTLEEKIAADYLMRVHRSYVINLHHIEEIQDNYVHIQQNYIPISRSYWDNFINKVNII